MEKWENKIIADKLNGLEDLPDGYSPNLSSKWEIIKQSLPAKSPGRLVKRWSMGLLLLVLLAMVVWQFYPAKENDVVRKNMTETKNTNETVVIEHIPGIVSSAEKKEGIQNVSPAKPAKTLRVKRHRVEPIFMNSATPVTDSIRIPKDTVKSFPPIAAIKPSPVKKVYQKDFAGIGNTDTTQTKTAHKKVEIKFTLRNHKSAPDNSSPSLRLMQNF